MNIRSPRSLLLQGPVASSLPRRVKTLFCVFAASTFGVAPLEAAWTLYQNFDALPVGYDIADNSNPNENFTVATQDIGAGNSGARYGGYTVIPDPTNAGNKLLELDAVGYAFTGQIVDASTGTANPIVNLQTGTLFYRVYRESVNNTPDINFGGADIGTVTDNTNNAANYQSQLNVSGGSVMAGTTDILRPRNGGGTVDTGVHWTAGTWFGIFQVIDTATNTTQFYYQGESDPAPILLTGPGGSPSNMAFRNGGSRPSTDIGYFLAVNGLPGGGVNDTFYIDDIYVDATSANLVSPVPISSVPEPTVAGVAFAALCGVALIGRRRRSC